MAIFEPRLGPSLNWPIITTQAMFQEPEITTSSETLTVEPCYQSSVHLACAHPWAAALTLYLNGRRVSHTHRKVTNSSQNLSYLSLFTSKNPIHPISGLIPWTATNPASVCWRVSRSSFLARRSPLTAVSNPSEYHLSALESAVSPFFTRISAFLPLSSASMFPPPPSTLSLHSYHQTPQASQ